MIKFLKTISVVLLTITVGCSKKAVAPIDFEVIKSILIQLDSENHLAKDLYPLIPPPPKSKTMFSELRDNPSKEAADSIYDKIKNNYEKQTREIANRKVDSSQIFIATNNFLISACPGCEIKGNKVLRKKYVKYLSLVKQLQRGTQKGIRIPFEELEPANKYRLKSMESFPARDELYSQKLDFLFAGEMYFSRFYYNQNIGVIYISYAYCYRDCGSGELVLLEKSNNEWRIIDTILQYIN